MQITDIQPITWQFMTPPERYPCPVCDNHRATLRVTFDHCSRMIICEWCVKLAPEIMFEVMKMRHKTSKKEG